MGKMKIHELAKKIGVTSKEIIEKAQKIGIAVTSHLSNIEEEQVDKIKEAFDKNDKVQKEKETVKKENAGNVKKESKPVIIRREVIIDEEEKTKQESSKKIETNRKDVGFVERNNSKDYNIVYRNKQTKPLTVSELFGIKSDKSKEEKKEVVIKEEKEPIKEVKEEKKEEVKVEEKNMTPEVKVENNTVKEKEQKNDVIHNTNNYRPREQQVNRNFDNHNHDNRNFDNRNNNYRNQNNNGYRNNQNGDNRSNYRNNQNGNNYRNNNDGRNNYRNNNGYNNQNGNRDREFNRNRPLDEKGIDKNIKNIMTTEVVEKELQRDYSNKVMEKQKANSKYDEQKSIKKATKSRKSGRFEEFDDGKLKDLKQVDRLSNMFEEQDGGMLEYYDLTTARGKKNKKKIQKNEEERNKQKIFELKEIVIPENITVKDLAAEMKKTTAEVIKKLLNNE